MPEWDDELDRAQAREDRRLQYGLAAERRAETEILLEQDEHPIAPEVDELPGRKLLKRDIKAMALQRMEDAARTPADFEAIVRQWDRLDANRERRERYHETLRNGMDYPLDYGAVEDGVCFPIGINHALTRQIRKGDFLDAILFCPLEIHEIVTEEYLSEILAGLKDEHKELLFLLAVCRYSTSRIAVIRGQSDRNIRKVRTTILKRLYKRVLDELKERAEAGAPMTLEEKALWGEYKKSVLDGGKGGSYNSNQK